jgi:hypothetical protein
MPDHNHRNTHFRERTGEDLPLEDFRDGENQFFS